MSQQLLQSRGMATEPSAQIVLDAQLTQLPHLEHWLQGLAGRFAWPPPLAHRIDLCLTELITNVISYGYPDGRAGAVSVRLWTQDEQAEQIVIRIDDDGSAFDPTAYVLPGLPTSLDDASSAGRGIRLVRHFADDMQYLRGASVRGAAENQLTLIFRNADSPSHPDGD